MPTTSTLDPMLPPEPRPSAPAGPALPTLEEIRHLPPGERRVYHGVDWGFYLRLHEVIGERPWLRIAFDGRDLEIMPTSDFHEFVKDFGFRLVEVIAEELDIPSASTGSTTWIRPEIERGIEADDSFHFAPDKLAAIGAAMARRSKDLADIPSPDLALEVDISPPQVDRSSIYAALRVPEIWLFRETGMVIQRLTEQGTYAEVEQSGFLPIRADEIARWVLREDRSNLLDWKRRLRAWVRAELAGRIEH